ncbi:hypothetical protein [Ramlibacter sp.]|uniref:hypothetical protein n=1 Tax=Ramlibacter sp. TaxID=1917967 RepID=UPI002CB6A7E1|nr:hypothetical protein [Ramlibacter sp.]HWI83622.1 hypothetical protein [Ramlibacter sp.]
MRSNCILFGWNRPIPGREATSGQLFQTFVEFLTVQQRAGTVESFEAVFLEPRGSGLNGFFIIRGEPDKLNAMTSSDQWARQQTKAIINLEDVVVGHGATGPLVGERMKMWLEEIPRA